MHVDRVVLLDALTRVESAGEQHLLDQRIEFGDVAFDLGLQVGTALGRSGGEHRHRHAHARQRRTQLVAGVGEQALVRAHQGLDATRRLVEARRQRRHLVVALHRNTVAELTSAELFDAVAQILQPPRQAAHHRPRAGRHRREQHAQQDHQLDTAPPGPRKKWQQPGRERHGAEGGPAGATHATDTTARPITRRTHAGAETPSRAHDPQGAAIGQRYRVGAIQAIRSIAGCAGRIAQALGECGRGGDARAVLIVERQGNSQAL